MSYDQAAQRAEGKIGIAIQRIADSFPFHAAVLERFKQRNRSDVGTMAVTVSGNDVILYHNPDFVLAITADELAGVVLHEIHHVLFGHVTADPTEYPDEWARAVAEEVTVNEFVPLPLPGRPITLSQFPALPPMESTDERYERLRKRKRRSAVQAPTDNPSALQNGSPLQPRDGSTHQTSRTDPSATSPHNAACTSGQKTRSRSTHVTTDDHSVWADAQHDLPRAREVVRRVIQGALADSGEAELSDAVVTALENLWIGRMPGRHTEVLRARKTGGLDWRILLRRYIGRAFEARPTFARPPRRMPELVGVLPGRQRRPRPRVLAAIDTSGSVSSALLALIDAELALLARRFDVTVVECDTEITAQYRYAGRLSHVTGRGGTDLRPPLAAEFLATQKADLIVYFTDGYGPAPPQPPRPPVIWCLVPGGVTPAPWGRVVAMDRPRIA